MGRPVDFPKPGDCPPNRKAVFCPRDQILKLYKQANKTEAKRLSQTVSNWFHAEALDAGWGGTYFLKEAKSAHGVGAVLFLKSTPGNVTITVNMVVLEDSAEVDAEE